MKVKCPYCYKVYNIPDERLPKQERKIAFPCRACKGLIEIYLQEYWDKLNSSQPAEEDLQNEPVEHSFSPKENLSGEDLKKHILRTVSDLPPMPHTVIKAQEIMQSSSSGMKQLSEVIETDQAITAKILRMANSSYYGLSGKVSSIKHAATLLGNIKVGDIITMAGTSAVLADTLEGYGLGSGEMWLHSLAAAFGSRIIIEKTAPDLSADAFTAGLLHDAGKMILDQYILYKKKEFFDFIAKGDYSFLEAEARVLGFDHAEIMSDVCKSWNIPPNITIGIRNHHNPSKSDQSVLAYTVHMADAIAMMSGIGTGADGMLYQMEEEAMEFLHLEKEDIREIMCEVVDSVLKLEEEKE